jgi:LuxR family maltose regulon positive regulatory protein
MTSTVLLVDDHSVFRKGLRLMLEEEQDLEVVGEAGDGREAIDLFMELRPDVVVMDISMNGLSGIEATDTIISEAPETAIVALSIHSGKRYVEGMLGAGAKGYILKDSAPEDLVEGIRTVTRGEVFLSPQIAEIVVSGFRESLVPASSAAGIEKLTVTDQEVLRLLVDGESDAQIAASLLLDQDTVVASRRRLFTQYGVQDVTALAESIRAGGMLAGESADEKAVLPSVESDATMRRIRRTKLYPPLVPHDHVHRPRLIEILDASFQAPLTLVSAPAGYGKSQMCSSWLQMCDLRSAWLSLDDDDDDLRRFLEYVLAAVGGLFPEALDDTQSLVDAAPLPPVSVVAETLANDLDQIEERFVLVLDDLHRVRSRPVHDLLTELLKYPPRSLHLVVITRRDPSLPMATLRANGRVFEVRTRQLRFTDAEAAVLLENFTGLRVSGKALAQVQRQMEGWVAGLRLVALALRHADNADALLTSMSGEFGNIREYLLREVLAVQTLETRDWMLKTSILDRFCGPLCTALCLGDSPQLEFDPQGAEFPRALERSNLFTIPLDSDGRWYRYHHLFQELLSIELKRRYGADEIAELHSRAAVWFENNGLIDEAIGHSLAGGDPANAAEIVKRHVRQEMRGGSWSTIKEWLEKLPESEILSRLELLVGRAFTHAFSAEFMMVPAILDRIDDLTMGDSTAPFLSREVAAFRGVCALHAGDGARALEHFDQALDRDLAGHPNLGAMIDAHFMVASQMEGRSEQARATAHKWLDEEPANDHRAVFLRHGLRLLHYLNGDLEQVSGGLAATRKLATDMGLDNTIAWCDYLSGTVLLQRGLISEAILHLEACVERKYRHWKQCAIDAQAALAVAHQANGSPEEAAQALKSLREFVTYSDSPQSIFADSCETRLQIMQGQLEPGGWWSEGPASSTTAPMFFFLDVPHITRCRALIADGSEASLNAANTLLQQFLELNESHHNMVRQIELRVLQAAAFDKQADPDNALTALGRAVELATPGGFVFPFLEPGKPMLDLLRRFRETAHHTAHVEHILHVSTEQTADKARAQPRHRPESQPLVAQLTNRETEVLELLAQRLLDKEISARLHISASTVNSHCKNIYQKLDVSNRRQAVATATELGLLDGDRD